MRRTLALALALAATGCYFPFQSYPVEGGSSTGGGSVGSSSGSGGGTSGPGNSGTGTGGTAGSGGSSGSGGTTGGGDAGSAGLCAAPDAGWPIHCTGPITVLDFSAQSSPNPPVQAVALEALPGGAYLIAAVDDSSGQQGFAAIYSPDAGSSDAGYYTGSPQNTGVAQAVALAGSPPALFLGQFSSQPAELILGDCYRPLTKAQPVSISYSYDSFPVFVGTLSAARAGDGTLGLLWQDFADGYLLMASDSDGGCPTNLQFLPDPSPSGFAFVKQPGALTPLDPFGSAPGFAVAQPILANGSAENVGVDVFYGLDGGAVAIVYDGGVDVGPVAIASDATGLAIFSTDDGIQLLRAPLAPDAGPTGFVSALSSSAPDAIAATACGRDCTLAAWTDPAAGTLDYAFVNAAGCGVAGAPLPLGSAQASGYDAVAVASAGGTAAIAYPVYDAAGSGQPVGHVYLVYCQ
ncbi:MAG: hypothetical protein ACYDCL_03370 [Myxococcales bacterium]